MKSRPYRSQVGMKRPGHWRAWWMDKGQKRRLERKLQLIELLGGKCMDCGYSGHQAAFEFDRVRGVKVLPIALMVHRSWESVLREVAKCELVCSNCHKVRTWSRLH